MHLDGSDLDSGGWSPARCTTQNIDSFYSSCLGYRIGWLVKGFLTILHASYYTCHSQVRLALPLHTIIAASFAPTTAYELDGLQCLVLRNPFEAFLTISPCARVHTQTMAQRSLKLLRIAKIPSPRRPGLGGGYFQPERGRFYQLACDAFFAGNQDDCHWQAVLSKHRVPDLNVRVGDGGENPLVLQPAVKLVFVSMPYPETRVEHLFALTGLPLTSWTVTEPLSRMSRLPRNLSFGAAAGITE
jgi:hypothetical protein